MTERRDLPLFAWSDAVRAARRRRAQRGCRLGGAAAGIACLGITIVAPPPPRLVWNASASAPIGLYRVTPGAPLERGDMVIAWAPAGPRALAAQRHYLPGNVPLVKRVAGVPGQRICAVGSGIFVDGRRVAARLARDPSRRPLPWWRGCMTLQNGALFLLMDAPASFDGRYFGPTSARDVIGKATPLWVG
jgi:conjugative transfer signal peptidase TraF